MQKDAAYLEYLCRRIESKLDWGPVDGWTTQDFEELSELIAAQTGRTVGATTLKRVCGRVRYESSPSRHTLTTLANFVGASSWREFKSTVDRTGQRARRRPATRLAWLAGARPWVGAIGAIVVALFAAQYFLEGSPVRADSALANVRFSSRMVATGLPNSVVFTYHIAGVAADSFFIQQSWDPRLRHRVRREGQEFTSLYYYPGHFWAKLIADDQILREHPLVVPTEGWLGLVQIDGPVPVYAPVQESESGLQIETGWLESHAPGVVRGENALNFYHVGGFAGVSDSLFSFVSEIRVAADPGRGPCRKSRIVLIAQHGRIDVPFSIPGCTADLNLVAGNRSVAGRENDLSGLGTDLSDWRKVTIEGVDGLVTISIDDQTAYRVGYEGSVGEIVGLRFRFEGHGQIRNVVLLENGAEAFVSAGGETVFAPSNQLLPSALHRIEG